VCGVEKAVQAVQIWTKGVGTVGPVAQKGQFADGTTVQLMDLQVLLPK